MPVIFPRVCSVVPQRDFSLILQFTNGEARIFDMNPYLKIGIFRTLKDWGVFSLAKTGLGTVIWPNELDISPDTLYLESRPFSPQTASQSV